MRVRAHVSGPVTWELSVTELKGSVGQILHGDKSVVAVEQNKVLIPPAFNKYLAWGFADMSVRIGNYDSDKVCLSGRFSSSSSCCRSRSDKDCFHHLTLALHLSLCCESDVQESIFMSLSFRFLLMVSLNRRRGRPLFL